MKARLRATLALACALAIAAPPGVAAPQLAAPQSESQTQTSGLDVRVAQAADFSHIEFRFPGARASTTRQGDKLLVHFSRYAAPDMRRLRVDPPKWLKSADDAKTGGGLTLTLTLADGADAKTGTDDGATFVNLFAKAAPPAAAASPTPGAAPAAISQSAPVVAERANPAPDSGVVKLQAQMSQGQVVLRFPWKNPLGAAVFRRGEGVWIVFDAAAKLDLSGAPLST